MMNTKKINSVICTLFLLLFLSNCKKELPPIPSHPPYNKSSSLELVWRTLQTDSSQYIEGISPLINSEGDVLISDRYNKGTRNYIFKLFDGITGKLKWEITPFVGYDESIYYNDEPFQINDVIIFSTHYNLYALNILTGKTLWKQNIDSLSGSYKTYNDNDGHIYFTNEITTNGITKNEIYRTYYNNLKWELVTTIIDSSNRYTNGISMAFVKNSSGKSLLIFGRDLITTANVFSSNIYCFNLTNKAFEWTKGYNNRSINSNSFPGKIICTNQNAIVTWVNKNEDKNYIAAINLDNGTLALEQNTANNSFNFFIYNNNPIIINNAFTALNQTSGNTIWQTNYHYYCHSSFAFKNYSISTETSNIWIFDLNNGAILFNKTVALPGWEIKGGVAINPSKRLLYFKDDIYLNCFKLPAEIIY